MLHWPGRLPNLPDHPGTYPIGEARAATLAHGRLVWYKAPMRRAFHTWAIGLLGGALFGAVLLGSAAPAHAQGKPAPAPAAGAPGAAGTEGNVKSKFYNFEDMLIDGEYKKPGALLSSARDQAKFERLFRLRKSFLQTMLQTAKEPALRH
jgi:hypothetical protein